AKIAPVPAGGDLPRGQYRERGQECNVDHSGELSAPDRRARDRHAACEPERGKGGQRQAIDRKTPRPVRNGGEQENGDDGRPIAVEHLVDMPVERREGGWQRQLTKILRQPQQDAECSPQRTAKKEWPKTIGK